MADTSLQGNYPTILNNVTYQPFGTWDVTFVDYVTTHETEGGSQEDSVTRRGRRSIRVGTSCLEPLARQLAGLEDLDEFTAKFYNIKTGSYVETTVRVKSGSMTISKKKKTDTLQYCKGLYDVSFTLEEF